MRPTWHDAFDAQMELWRWLRTEMGRDWVIDRAKQVFELDWQDEDLVQYVERGEPLRDILLRANPFFVAAEMCEVIEAAALALAEQEPLLQSDLLATHGFVFFERPVLFPNPPATRDADFTGFSWGMDNVNEPRAIFPTTYQEWPEEWGQVRPEFGPMPRMIPTPLPVWAFEEEPPLMSDGISPFFIVVATGLRLMKQFVPAKHHVMVRPDRINRRQAKKVEFPERDITVVRLRREKQPHAEPSGKTIDYSHRFLRSGHWRNQWYPSLHRHRMKWINPTIVGPPDKPLRSGKQRVFTWTR